MSVRVQHQAARRSDPARHVGVAAARSLASQALPFEQCGWRISDRVPARIELEGSPHPVVLRYRTQRMLLARIHQLQIIATVASVAGPPAPCTFELRTHGGDRTPRWVCRADGSMADDLTGSAVEALARKIDLVSCTATWCPRSGRWRLRIEPYAGSHLRVYFPPITYTTTLRASEAEVITGALAELSAAVVVMSAADG